MSVAGARVSRMEAVRAALVRNGVREIGSLDLMRIFQRSYGFTEATAREYVKDMLRMGLLERGSVSGRFRVRVVAEHKEAVG